MVIQKTPTKIDKIVSLRIGQHQENAATQIKMDVSDWITVHPTAGFHILFKRPGEVQAQPVLSSLEEGILTWTVQEWETSLIGVGYAEVRAIEAESALVAKSRVIPCSIEESVTEDGDVPPEYSGWVERILEVADLADDLEQSIADGIEDIQAEGTTQMGAVQAKGTEVINSLPADYLSLVDQFNALVRVQANQPSEAANKLWVDSDTVTETEVPTMDEFNELKSAVGEYTLDVGYRNVAPTLTHVGVLTANNAYRGLLLNVVPGERIRLTGTGGAGGARLWATADKDGRIIRRAEPSTVATSELVVTIEDGEGLFVYNTSFTGSFYCYQESAAPLIGKTIVAIQKNETAIENNNDSIEQNEQQIENIVNSNNNQKIPYISAKTKSASTTNYMAVVLPKSVFPGVNAGFSFDCYCEDDVTVYCMCYEVDLTQTGNARLTNRIHGQVYTSTKENGWYHYDNSINISTPATDYAALVFNLIPTDNTERIIDGYFSNIKINGINVNNMIHSVFMYGAALTANDICKLYPVNIIGLSHLLEESGIPTVGDGKILCIGDSLTAGVYASDQQVHAENYPYYMKQIVSNEVVNKGMPGYSASMYWNNNVLSASDFVGVKHIIIMLGTNGGLTDTLEEDVYAYDDYEDYATTKTGCYCKIIEYCMEQAPNAEIYLCTTPFYNKDIVPQFAPPTTPNANAVIPKIAEHYNFSVIDVRHGMGINQKNTLVFQSDGLHGDSGFYQKLGTFIGSQLKAKASFIV